MAVSLSIICSLQDMPNMKWEFMSVDALTYETGTFDINVDKGTLDAIEQNLPLLEAAIKEAPPPYCILS